MMLLALAAFIPPPPGWQPPQARGPGAFCGIAFTLALEAGETIAQDWPGEVFINDVYGSYRITRAGADEVVVTENGPRTRPRGASRRVVGGFRRFEPGTYALRVSGNRNVAAVTVRFPAGVGQSAAEAFLRRVRAGSPPAGTACLAPENR